MEQIKVPEKIYVNSNPENRTWLLGKSGISSIEYTRTDAFIEKVARFLENKLYDRVEIQVFGTIIPSLTSKKAFIEDFIKYMKGE